MLHAGDFEDEFLLPWLNMEYELLRIFKDKNEVLREVGEDGISWEIITPEDLIEGIQWTPRGSHSVQKNATLAQLMVLLFRMCVCVVVVCCIVCSCVVVRFVLMFGCCVGCGCCCLGSVVCLLLGSVVCLLLVPVVSSGCWLVNGCC